MGHNVHGINLYDVLIILVDNVHAGDNSYQSIFISNYIVHKNNKNTRHVQVYSVHVMTHVIALKGGNMATQE